jgi:hypothetical protein
MRYTGLLFVFLVLTLVHIDTVSAGGGLSIETVFQDVSFSAEVSQVDFLVTLTNTTAESLTLRPSVVDFGSLDESGGWPFWALLIVWNESTGSPHGCVLKKMFYFSVREKKSSYEWL